MLDETVETRRPWHGSPRTCVHAGAFLCFMGIISTVSKSLRYALLLKRVSPHPSPAYVPYVVAEYSGYFSHITVFVSGCICVIYIDISQHNVYNYFTINITIYYYERRNLYGSIYF